MKKITLKNDYLFKEFFSKEGNELFLKDFLSEILKKEITKIEVKKDVSLTKGSEIEKYGVLDIRATIDSNEIIDVEMQRTNVGDIGKRTIYYSSKLMAEQLRAGEDYDKLKPVIVISILNYNVYNHNNYITKSYIIPENNKEELRKNTLTFYDIELPKVRETIKKETKRNKLLDWLIFIDNENKEEVKMVVERNKVIAKAQEEYEYLTGTEAKKRKAELIEKQRKDMASAKGYGYRIGVEVGIKKGLEQGLQEGIEQEKENNIKNMILNGITTEMIMKITGANIDKINRIKENIKSK